MFELALKVIVRGAEIYPNDDGLYFDLEFRIDIDLQDQ